MARTSKANSAGDVAVAEESVAADVAVAGENIDNAKRMYGKCFSIPKKTGWSAALAVSLSGKLYDRS